MPCRILIIDSEEDRLIELRVSLEAEGYTVVLARDGMEGLEVGKQFQPDLIITEVLLNRMSGFELSSRIAAGAGNL